MGEFTHFDMHGNARMVDVGNKSDTNRIAVASGRILMSEECYRLVRQGGMKKGDVLGVARVAGIMGTKKTSELIPMCHNILINKAELQFEMYDDMCAIEAICTVETCGKTGVEMEALTGVNVALLTIYDMCKAVDRGMIIEGVHLQMKSGGKSGVYKAEDASQVSLWNF